MATITTHASPRLPIIALAFFLLMIPAAHVFAQGVQTGIIRGTAVDQQNLALPGVTVTITSPALQGQRSTATAVDGSYVFRALPAGEYEVAFGLSGFSQLKRTVTLPPRGGSGADTTTTQARGEGGG